MSEFFDKLRKKIHALFKISKSVVVSAYTWIILSAVVGVASICYGVFLLTSLAYSLIVLGTFLLLFGMLIARGAANG